MKTKRDVPLTCQKCRDITNPDDRTQNAIHCRYVRQGRCIDDAFIAALINKYKEELKIKMAAEKAELEEKIRQQTEEYMKDLEEKKCLDSTESETVSEATI